MRVQPLEFAQHPDLVVISAGLELPQAVDPLAESYRYGAVALDLLRKNPDARLGAMVACSWDEEAGWYAVVRGVRLQEKGPTDDGHRLSQSCMVSWFASGMASADAYDWCGDSHADLARAHELPIPTQEG